jgi:ureidoglycolate dehydrogenase (NAD+)
MSNIVKVESELLTQLCTEILKNNHVPSVDALSVAKSLVNADLRGVNSHGVMRLPLYLECLKDGSFESVVDMKIVKKTKTTAVIDGGNGLGQVVSQKAVDIIIEETKEKEMFAVAVRNSNHFGAAGYWADQLQKHNMIGIVASNVPPIMPAPGGAEARVGNNPIAIAVPTGQDIPIMLDMATSTVPFGKILNYKNKGEKIPEGWAVNSSGKMTTDPEEVVMGGSLFPVGGPKGYGLSVIIEVLSALLSGGAIGSDIHVLHNTVPNNVSFFFLGIRIDGFIEPEAFKQKVDHYIQFIKSTKLAEGVNEVYLPGELEHKKEMSSRNEGILLPDTVMNQLVTCAKEAKVDDSIIHSLS